MARRARRSRGCIAAKLRPQWIRWSMLAVAMLVFALGLIVEFALPQNVGF
jgi:hypothetical protein